MADTDNSVDTSQDTDNEDGLQYKDITPQQNTYGQQAWQQLQNVLLPLLKMSNPVMTGMAGGPLQGFDSGKAGVTIGQGIGEGLSSAAQTPIGGPSPYDQIKAKVANNVLTKYLTPHAENLVNTHPQGAELLAAIASPQLYTSNKQNNMMQNAESPMGQWQQNNTQAQAPQQQAPAQQQQQQNPMATLLQNMLQGASMGGFATLGITPQGMAQAQLMRQQAVNATPQGAYNLKMAEAQVPMTKAQKQEKLIDMQNTLPTSYAESQQAMAKSLDTIKSVLTPMEQAGMMVGNQPAQIRVAKQQLGGVLNTSGPMKGQVTGGTANNLAGALKSKVKAIQELQSGLQQNQNMGNSFSTPEEADRAGTQVGDTVIINGRVKLKRR